MKKFSQFAIIDAFTIAFTAALPVRPSVSVNVFKQLSLCTVRVTCDAGAPDERTVRKLTKQVAKDAKAELELLRKKPLNAREAEFTFRMVPQREKNRAPTKAQFAKWARATKRTRDLERKRARLAIA